MDFYFSFQIALATSSIIMAIALWLFIKSYRRVSSRLSSPSRKSLMLFGLSALVYQFSVAMSVVNIIVSRSTFSFGPVLLVFALIELVFENRTSRLRAEIGFFFYFSVSFFLIMLNPLGPLKYFTMVIVVGIIFVLVARLHMVAPSPFTYSSFGVALTTIPLYFTVMQGFIFIEPHYFPAVILGLSLIAAFLASMLKPWRMIPTLYLTFFGTILAISIIIPAIVAGDAGIYIFVIFAYMVSLALVLPFEYFMAESERTHARTPFYIAITLMAIGFLIETHWVNWAYAYNTSPAVGQSFSNILFMYIQGTWDTYIIFADWALGIIAVSVFLLAALSTTYSVRVTDHVIDILILIGVPLALLAFPPLNEGRYDISSLYIPLLILILISTVIYGRLAWQLANMGHSSAARRFIIFMLGALFAGLVSMFSDRVPFIMDPIMQTIAIVLLTFSTPGNPLRRFVRILTGKDEEQMEVI